MKKKKLNREQNKWKKIIIEKFKHFNLFYFIFSHLPTPPLPPLFVYDLGFFVEHIFFIIRHQMVTLQSSNTQYIDTFIFVSNTFISFRDWDHILTDLQLNLMTFYALFMFHYWIQHMRCTLFIISVMPNLWFGCPFKCASNI